MNAEFSVVAVFVVSLKCPAEIEEAVGQLLESFLLKRSIIPISDEEAAKVEIVRAR
jgi:hypothetical protein